MKKANVIVETEDSEKTRPVSVILPDGRYCRIEKVMHCTVSPGEYEGVRYSVLVGNKERFLYRNGKLWYVFVEEGKG